MGKTILRNLQSIEKVLLMTCDTMFVIDADNICVDAFVKTNNPVFNPDADIIDRNLISLLPSPTAEQVKEALAHCRHTGEVSNANYDLPTPDQVFYFKLIVYKYDEKYLLCQYRDITQRSNMKNRLQSALTALLEVGKVAKIGQWSFDLEEEEFVHSGYSIIRNYNLSAPDHISLADVLASIHTDDRQRIRTFLFEEGHSHDSVSYRLIDSSGDLQYVKSTKYHRRLDNDRLIIDGFSQNVSGFIKNRNELEMMLEVVFHAPYSIHANRFDGSLIFANKECRLQNKISLDADIIDLPVSSVMQSFESQKEWDYLIDRLQQTNGFLLYRCDQPYPDSNIIGAECSSFIIKNGSGEDVVWTIRRDISDQLRYEEQLLKSKEAAEASEKLKSTFISNMNHEIRTPLSAIIGFSNIIAETEDPDLRKEYGKILSSNGAQLLRLVTDVLEMSSMDGGRVGLSPEPLSLNTILHELELSFGKSEDRAELIFDIPSDDVVVKLDGGRVVQLLTNLINNAIKFTLPSGCIQVGYTRYAKDIELYVRDNGIGIPADRKEAIFQRFYKVNDADNGTGLGLAICKAIVEQMHGTISVESELGKGSTFRIRIPYSESM